VRETTCRRGGLRTIAHDERATLEFIAEACALLGG
jgi:hypothetical protein